MSELKACPFCGSDKLAEFKTHVMCHGCETDGPYRDIGDDPPSAAELWNRRAPALPDEIVERVREVIAVELRHDGRQQTLMLLRDILRFVDQQDSDKGGQQG